MDPRLIGFAVPLFLLLVAVEWLVSRRRGAVVYRFQDSVASLATGVVQQASELWLGLWAAASYMYIYERFHLQVWEVDSLADWLLVGLAVDFLYYWFHRASHRVNILWAAHVVHHQSEEYNLTTALRQSSLQPLFNAVFFWPLAVVGVPVTAVALSFTINLLYQFWIHTRLVGDLGPLEWILCTPANHRVHHGSDALYLDKNYGGILIIWDRLFGTYQRERSAPRFGTVTPLRSWNPLWANVVYFHVMLQKARQARRLRDRFYVLVAPPEWQPDSCAPARIEKAPPVGSRYEAWSGRRLSIYITYQFAISALVLVFFKLAGAQLADYQAWLLAIYLTLGVTAWGGLFERKRWAVPLEYSRHVGALVFVVFLLSPLWAGLLVAAIPALSMLWLFGLQWRRVSVAIGMSR